MARRSRPDPDPESDIVLAPAPTPQQLRRLRQLGYKGPTPSTGHQAAIILRQLTSTILGHRKVSGPITEQNSDKKTTHEDIVR